MYTDSLQHYGVKGQSWGVRRFQNVDGTLTPAGREHYNVGKAEETTKKEHPEQYTKNARQQYADDVKKNRFYAGKRIENERKEYEKKTFEEMANKSEAYKAAKDKRELIRDVDPKNADQYYKFRKVKEDYKEEKRKLNEEVQKKSREMIEKKYGKQALSDIDYYNDKHSKQKTIGFLAGFAAMATALIIGVKKYANSMTNSNNSNTSHMNISRTRI